MVNQAKKCKKGYSCGKGCINVMKVCRKGLTGQAVTLADNYFELAKKANQTTVSGGGQVDTDQDVVGSTSGGSTTEDIGLEDLDNLPDVSFDPNQDITLEDLENFPEEESFLENPFEEFLNNTETKMGDFNFSGGNPVQETSTTAIYTLPDGKSVPVKIQEDSNPGGGRSEKVQLTEAEKIDDLLNKLDIQGKQDKLRDNIERIEKVWEETGDNTVVPDDLRKENDELAQELRNAYEEYDQLVLPIMAELRDRLISTGQSNKEVSELLETMDINFNNVRELGSVNPEEIAPIVGQFLELTNAKLTNVSFISDGGRPYNRESKYGGFVINIGNVNSEKLPEVLFHELAHQIEYNNPKVKELANRFILSRASGSEQSLRELTGANYPKDEKAYPDNFIDPYVGKIYPDRGVTEVISMGLEHFATPEGMAKLYRKDPEHFMLMLHILNFL